MRESDVSVLSLSLCVCVCVWVYLRSYRLSELQYTVTLCRCYPKDRPTSLVPEGRSAQCEEHIRTWTMVSSHLHTHTHTHEHLNQSVVPKTHV